MGLVGPAEDPVDFTPAGEDEQFIYSPTDRPGEPVTAGAPIGPGADISTHTVESDAQFKQRVAERMAATSASPEVRRFVERVQRGL